MQGYSSAWLGTEPCRMSTNKKRKSTKCDSLPRAPLQLLPTWPDCETCNSVSNPPKTTRQHCVIYFIYNISYSGSGSIHVLQFQFHFQFLFKINFQFQFQILWRNGNQNCYCRHNNCCDCSAFIWNLLTDWQWVQFQRILNRIMQFWLIWRWIFFANAL